MLAKSLFVLMSSLALVALGPARAQEGPKQPGAEQVRQAIKAQLPAPPEGFSWHVYKNAVFMKPVEWHEREKNASVGGIPANVYAASPDEFSETKQFETGITIQIYSGPQKVRRIEAKKFALLYLKPFLDAHRKDEILILEQRPKGDFEQIFFRYRDASPGMKPIIVHKFILANNVTDSVHVFTFESPVELWEANWAKYGTPILGKVNVIPNLLEN